MQGEVMVDEIKRPNRHSNPVKPNKKQKHRHIFFRHKNRQVREILKVMA
jgi:hypothetical protein